MDQITNNNNNNTHSNQLPSLAYTFKYTEPTLTVELLDNQRNENFTIELKFKVPNQLDIEEIIYRLCSFKEEQFLMLEIQEIELITAKSTSRIFNLFKSLINYDEEFESSFKNELDMFVRQQNQMFYDGLVKKSVFNPKLEETPLSDSFQPNVISYWKTLLNSQNPNSIDETTIKSPNSSQDSSYINMAKVYHSLLHSSQMLTVLQRERNYAIDMNNMLREKEATLRYVMDEEQLDAETFRWTMKLDNLKLKQQRNFKKFLQKLYDQIDRKAHISDGDDDDYVYELSDQLEHLDSFKEKFSNIPAGKSMSDLYSKTQRLEESYTIQLGAQLKSTHNLRLIRCNIFEFCKDRFVIDESAEPVKKKNDAPGLTTPLLEPQAIQTAMSLYSDKLCALILLVENSFDDEDEHDGEEMLKNEASQNNAQNWHYLKEICEKNGGEFHFLGVEEQKKVAYRLASTTKKNYSTTNFSNMNIGDFYITKHSNLSQVHVIFNLAANEKKVVDNSSVPTSPPNQNKTLKLPDLSSRHPVILGLRNILKICISNNINTLTLPLLLTHEMNEDMTISWVMKRAELVLKCLKGFMIEFVQWGAQESRTIQFVVPQGLMDETFNSLSNLIPTIFRESRTVNLV